MADDEDDQELYDEFGNYIGPDLNDEDSDDDSSNSEGSDNDDDDSLDRTNVEAAENNTYAIVEHQQQPENAIVLHEDKDHYPSASQVYGEDVRAVVLDEDAMDLDTPIVEPLPKNPTSSSSGDDSTVFNYTDEYLNVHLLNETTRTRRAIALIGHLHHGKTSLVDLLLEPTIVAIEDEKNKKKKAQKSSAGVFWPSASLDVASGGGPRHLDMTKQERERQLSLQASPMTMLLPDSRGKSFCLSILDCPGHPQFHDETCASLAICDGAVLVVDVVEGMQMHTEMALRQAVSEGLPICLVLSKVDRIICELKLPVGDAYHKICRVIDSVNAFVARISNRRYPKMSPERGNVAFSSAQHGWLFTLESFAATMSDHAETDLELAVPDLAKRLWGDCFYDRATRQFQSSARDCSSSAVKRTFCEFVLAPIYKIYAACLGEGKPDTILRQVGVLLSKEQLRASTRPLLRASMSKFIAHGGFVDMVVQHVPHPAAAAMGKLARCYTGEIEPYMKECDPQGPLVVHCVKNYFDETTKSFWTLGRIYSGTLRPAETVKVLGESYNDDEEDAAVATIEGLAIPRGRGRMHVSVAKAGNWVLLQGVDATIAKTATLVANNRSSENMRTFKPLKFPFAGGESVMKLAIEPLNPAALPKMVEGLRRMAKAYPMATTKVEESGEHVVLGTGELYLDCLMHDLRYLYSDIEIKVADPIVSLHETVVETSSLKCFSETANKRNKLTLIAEPMDDGLAEQLEAGKVNLQWPKKKLGRFFQTKYNWDLLSSRSVWAFGDSPTHGTNLLMDDTLPSEVDKALLSSCRSSIVQGFQWATREGPLCEEPVRATKLKILDATLADKPIYRGGGQVIPTARRTVHSALLTATPRLLEPVYRLEIQCPGSMVESIQPVLTRRRGHVVQDRPIPGSTLFNVRGYIPVLDSFGFETDLRTFTQGQAMVLSVFDHWSIVPGDPLDRSILLHPLEPSPPVALARELLVKTRRRKGLSEDVSIDKFFDAGMKSYLASQKQQQEEGDEPALLQ